MKKLNDLSLKEKVHLIGSAFISIYDDEYGKVTFITNNDNDEVLIMIGKSVYKLEMLDFNVTSIHAFYRKDDKSVHRSFDAYMKIDVENKLKSFLDII